MGWLETGTWILLALFLAALHVWIPRERPARPTGVFSNAVVAALIGGYFIRILRIASLRLDGFSLSALIAAGIFAEIGIRMALAARGGARPRPLRP
jgi:hypothetical protein